MRNPIQKNYRKLLCTFMVHVLVIQLLMIFPISAFAAESGITGDVSWSLDGGVLTVSGTGAMADYSSKEETPWYAYISDIESVVISEGVYHVGTHAFDGCTNLSSVSFPETLYRIDQYSFYGCTSLTEITIPRYTHEICYGAFGNSGLTKVTVLSRAVEYVENENYETALTFPSTAVFYCTYGETEYFCQNNNLTYHIIEDELLIKADSGNSTYDFIYNDYVVANLWKATKAQSGAEGDIVLDYTFTVDADEVKNEHNLMADSDSQKISPDNDNGGEIKLEVSLSFEDEYYNFSGARNTAYYGYRETDPIGRENTNYNKWEVSEGENPFITITPSGKTATVTVKGTVKELYEFATKDLEEELKDYKAINAMSLSIRVEGITYRPSSNWNYLNEDKKTQPEYRYVGLYDAHARYAETERLGPRTLETKNYITDTPHAEISGFMEPTKKNYLWSYEIQRISRDYVEELDRNPGDGGYEDDIFFEEYNGITYGHVRGEYDAGEVNTMKIADFITEENSDFINSLIGVTASGLGGEVMIMADCSVILTFPDGETKTLYVSACEETTFLVSPCMHSCKRCGLCTSDEMLHCNTMEWFEFRCICEEPQPDTVVTEVAPENKISFENNTWNEELTLNVVYVDVEESKESDYIRHIGDYVDIKNTVMLFDASLTTEYGPYIMNQWGGEEENVTVTVNVGVEIADLIDKGEAELCHIAKGTSEVVPCEADTANGTITFNTMSLSPFAIVKTKDFQHYGKAFLTDAQKSVYEALETGITNCDESIPVDRELGLKIEDIRPVIEMFLADHPGYFWFPGSYTYSHYSGIVASIIPKYTMAGSAATKTQIEEAKDVYEAKLDAVIDEMETKLSDPTDYERALWLHDKVAEIVTYEYGPNHQTAYGALVDQKAVCAGYAELYQALLLEAGIPAWSVKGASINPVTQEVQNHEWNLLWIDDSCVYADVTWDDQMDEIFHIYFARDITGMNPEHALNSSYSDKIPECVHGKCDKYTYYDKVENKHILTEEVTADMLAEIMTEQIEGKSFVTMLYAPNDEMLNSFNAWLNEDGNVGELVGKLIPSSGYSYIYWENIMGNSVLGEEIHLHIEKIAQNTEVTVSEDEVNGACNAVVSLGVNDYDNTNARAIVTYYDQNGTSMKKDIETIDVNGKFTMDIPTGAKKFKAMIIDITNMKPLCSAGVIELN